MIAELIEILSRFIIDTINVLGYWGIVCLMAIESACIPLPSEIIMPFSGYLVLTGRFDLWVAGFMGALGCVVGSVVAYTAGIYGGRPWVEKYGRYILISHRDIKMADQWFSRYGEAAIFFSRLLPVIRTFISLPAGIARMPFWRFIIYTFLGSLPWCLGLAYVGLQLGHNWPSLRHYFHKFDVVIGLAGVAAVVWYVHRHLRHLKEIKADLRNERRAE